MNSKKHVAYYRVSTERQGQSGLGLEGQQKAVEGYCEPCASFTEVESGTNKQRPELARAIATCKRLGATLVIAKLDRLARNVHFVSGLMESGVEFVACDNPQANRLTVHILAAVAEDEARRISERTKAALAAYKARGGVLGKPENLTREASNKGNKANSEAAERHRETIKPIAERLRKAGNTLSQIASELTEKGLLTRRGKGWSSTAVLRLLTTR